MKGKPMNIPDTTALFKSYQLAILAFCTAACKRQGAAAVLGMVNAWNYAAARFAVEKTVTLQDIVQLAALVDPANNDGRNLRDADAVAKVTRLLDAQGGLTADDFCNRFMRLAPVNAGNTRLATVLFNVVNGTLNVPELPRVLAARAA